MTNSKIRKSVIIIAELDVLAISALRRAIAEVKQRWSVIEFVTNNHLELIGASEGTLSR
jgi:hypothetical protein